jgi:hypothetical protein
MRNWKNRNGKERGVGREREREREREIPWDLQGLIN